MKRTFALLLSGALLISLLIYACDKPANEEITPPQNKQLSHRNLTEGESNAVACGHALSSIMLGINNLSQEDYCTLANILYDQNLTTEQKWNAINNEPSLTNFVTTLQTSVETLQNKQYASLYEDPSERSTVTNTLLSDIGFNPTWINDKQNADPCTAYKAAIQGCVDQATLCVSGVAVGCVGSLLGYLPCVAVGATICAIGEISCGNTADASYPNCVPAGRVVFHSWIEEAQCDPNYANQ